MASLVGKVALVTGASRGIGRACAQALARAGARVALSCVRHGEQARQVARRIQDEGGETRVLSFDVGCKKEVDEGVRSLEQHWGGVDVLVNNAGIVIDGLCVRLSESDWQRVLQVNLSGAFFCAQACVSGMMKRRWGRIINISSVVAETGNGGQTAYAAAKAGLLGLTKSLALELAPRGITVNAVTPGYIDTDMTAALPQQAKQRILEQVPLGRMGRAEDVAEAVAFLAGEEASYITGHTLAVNGGLHRA